MRLWYVSVSASHSRRCRSTHAPAADVLPTADNDLAHPPRRLPDHFPHHRERPQPPARAAHGPLLPAPALRRAHRPPRARAQVQRGDREPQRAARHGPLVPRLRVRLSSASSPYALLIDASVFVFERNSGPTALDALLFAYLHVLLHPTTKDADALRFEVTRRVNLVAWERRVRSDVQAAFATSTK